MFIVQGVSQILGDDLLFIYIVLLEYNKRKLTKIICENESFGASIVFTIEEKGPFISL